MRSRVVRFAPRRELMDREAFQQFLELGERLGIPPGSMVGLARWGRRFTRPEASEWPGGYSMVSLEWVDRAWNAIDELPGRDRPAHVHRAFRQVLVNLSPDTGEVLLSRDELAERARLLPQHASSAMSVLVRLGLVVREYVPSPGVRGRGVVRYAINAHVAWNGSLRERQLKAAQQSLPFRVVHSADA